MRPENKDHIDRRQYLLVQDPGVLQAPLREEEISLVDVWLILTRHKRRMGWVFALVMAVVLALVGFSPRLYQYTTVIEIARIDDKLLENPETVLAKLQRSYIPYVQMQVEQESPQEWIDIEARIPKKSTLVVLESEATEEEKPYVRTLHEKVVGLLAADHEDEVTAARLRLQAQLRQAQGQLADLKDKENLLQAREHRLEKKEVMLNEQLERIRTAASEARETKLRINEEVSGESLPLAMILVDREIQRYLEREQQLQEQLQIDIARERAEIAKERAEMARDRAHQEEVIRELQSRLSIMQGTRAISTAISPGEPASPRPMLLITIGFLAATVTALLAAFFAEFMGKVRAKTQGDESP